MARERAAGRGARWILFVLVALCLYVLLSPSPYVHLDGLPPRKADEDPKLTENALVAAQTSTADEQAEVDAGLDEVGAGFDPVTMDSDDPGPPEAEVPDHSDGGSGSAEFVAPCGGAPAHMVPFNVHDSPFSRAANGAAEPTSDAVELADVAHRRRRLLHVPFGLHTANVGCSQKPAKVVHEHDGVGAIVQKDVKPGEEPLVECLHNLSKCTAATRPLARALPSIRLAQSGMDPAIAPILLNEYGTFNSTATEQVEGGNLLRPFKTCAMVGNAGHIASREYGEYIDRHELVVRFNVLGVQGFERFVGNKTSLRVVNHRRSVTACCRSGWPEAKAGDTKSGIMLWFSPAQNEILQACEKKFPENPRFKMDTKWIKQEVEVMKMIREDLQRLGYGSFGRWMQLTSGAHAVLLFHRLCDSVSLYGFSTYNEKLTEFRGYKVKSDLEATNTNASIYESTRPVKLDQYGGRVARAGSGQRFHDWKGENFAMRLLHAAGIASICSA